MRSILPLLLSSLLSCGGLTALAPADDDDGDDTGRPDGEADADTDADSDSDSDADSDADTDGDIAITTVEPSTGSSAGGDEVTITGGPFDGETRVWFGGSEGSVSGWGTSQLLVETPSYSSSGAVDVEVETGTGETGRKASGFTYIADNSGMAGVIGELYWTEMVGGYWESPDEWGGAYMWFIEPQDVHFWQFYTSSLDTCVNGASAGAALSMNIYDPGQSSVSITSTTGQAISMSYDSATGAYVADDIAANKYVNNGWYELGDMSSSGVPTDPVEFFTRGASSFSVTQPMISGTNPPNIQKAQSVVWSGATGDWIVIYASMRDASGAAEADSVYCVAKNDGSFQIDQTKWNSWTSGRIVDLFVMVSREEGATLSHDSSDSRVVGTYIMYGAGYGQ